MTPVRSTGALAALVLVALTGCGNGDDAARGVTTDFRAAVGERDWQTACDLLAPTTRTELEESAKKHCPEALAEEDGPSDGSLTRSRSSGRWPRSSTPATPCS